MKDADAQENKNIAIEVNGVYKDFDLPHEKEDNFKNKIIHPLKSRSSVEKQHALKDISFKVEEGEFFGIVGRNGSGKSTLLKIIAEIYTPTKGQVKVHGSLTPFIELGVGFNPNLTGRENVYLNGAMLGFDRKNMDDMYDDIVNFAELGKFMDQKLKNYSSGMQVRLAFSVAIRAKSDILLLDEVLAVGDEAFQRKCFDYFKRLKHEKKTVVFISHDMEAIQNYCDRCVLLENSVILKEGAPRVIANRYSKKLLSGKSKDTESISTNPSGEERWGSERAKFTSSRVRVIGKNIEQLEIIASLKAKEDIQKPILGFSIKDSSFTHIIGTNTTRKHLNIQPLKKGEVLSFRWVVPNVLNRGLHYVDITAAEDYAGNVMDRWPDSCNINIYREESNPYPAYSPDVKLEVISK